MIPKIESVHAGFNTTSTCVPLSMQLTVQFMAMSQPPVLYATTSSESSQHRLSLPHPL
jgi:hypothetical protein